MQAHLAPVETASQAEQILSAIAAVDLTVEPATREEAMLQQFEMQLMESYNLV